MRQLFFPAGILIFLLLNTFSSHATPSFFEPYIVKSFEDDYGDIRGSMYILKQDHNEYKAEDIFGHPAIFSRYGGEELSKDAIYWFAFRIQNTTDSDIHLNLYLGDFDFFEFYEMTEEKVQHVIKGGSLRPAWDLTFPDENRYAVPIELKTAETKTCLIKVENSQFFSPFPVFELYSRDKFDNLTNLETRNFWQGIFQGVLWVMIVYNIFFALIGNDRTYLYYALYMIAISFYFLNIFGYLTRYVYPNHPELGTYVWLIMQTAAIFYIIFVRKFLNLKQVHGRWHRISKYLLIAVIIFVLFKAAYFLVFKEYGILSNLSQIVLFLGVVFTAGLIFSLYRTDNQLAKYFTIGSLSLGMGLLVASVIAFTGEPFSKNFFYSIQTGIVFEIFFFSIGLSYKMKESERDKRMVQEELIHQLKENEQLQLTYQRELEQKVIERTSEIQEQKQVLETQKARLEELNEDKNHLIRIVAHDLRNPLTSALSMAQLLESESSEEEKSEIGKALTGSLKRMNDMIEKILDIRAIESRKVKIEKESFNMGEETHYIIDQFTGAANKKSIRIHRDLKPAVVYLDKHYFKQIVENLVSNAIKFSPENKNVFISTFQKNGKALLVIKDEGPGFTGDDKKRLFKKYQKLSARPTAGESSTGIGLSIVKKYVLAMNGNISCDSELGKGAIFTVEFNNNRS